MLAAWSTDVTYLYQIQMVRAVSDSVWEDTMHVQTCPSGICRD
jgi:hypothetical protein